VLEHDAEQRFQFFYTCSARHRGTREHPEATMMKVDPAAKAVL
jgi:hypothetical protein